MMRIAIQGTKKRWIYHEHLGHLGHRVVEVLLKPSYDDNPPIKEDENTKTIVCNGYVEEGIFGWMTYEAVIDKKTGEMLHARKRREDECWDDWKREAGRMG